MSDDNNEVLTNELIRKAVAFEETLAFSRRYLYKTRHLDIIYLEHLIDTANKCWWVCDLDQSGVQIYEGFTFVECLEWALEQPEKGQVNE